MAKKKGMKWLYHVVEILLIIGGLNWGLVGVFDFNLVAWLLGTGFVAKAIYTIVGVSALYLAGYKIKEGM